MEEQIRTKLIELGYPFNENLRVKETKFGYFKLIQNNRLGKVDIINHKTQGTILKVYSGDFKTTIKL